MEFLEVILQQFIRLAILLFEYIGVGVITFAGIQGIVNYVRRRPDAKVLLAKGLAVGLEFKLGSEILRTVAVRSLEEIYIVAGIVILRAILAILIHWEIGNEKKELELESGRGTERSSGIRGTAAAVASAVAESLHETAAAPDEAQPAEESASSNKTQPAGESASSDNTQPERESASLDETQPAETASASDEA